MCYNSICQIFTTIRKVNFPKTSPTFGSGPNRRIAQSGGCGDASVFTRKVRDKIIDAIKYGFFLAFSVSLPLTSFAQAHFVRMADMVADHALNAAHQGLTVKNQNIFQLPITGFQFEAPVVSAEYQGSVIDKRFVTPTTPSFTGPQGFYVSEVRAGSESGNISGNNPVSEQRMLPSSGGGFVLHEVGVARHLLPKSMFDGRMPYVPAIGVDSDFALGIVAGMVYAEIMEGKVDAKDEQWRPYLARIASGSAPQGTNPEIAFDLLLAGCIGTDRHSQMRVAENWARRYDGGKYLPVIAFASARKYFNSGDYKMTIERLATGRFSREMYAVSANKTALDAMLLKVLCEANLRDMKKARETLSGLRKWELSPADAAEVSYMEAWLALSESKLTLAADILRRLIKETPQSPAADKAKKILDALE